MDKKTLAVVCENLKKAYVGSTWQHVTSGGKYKVVLASVDEPTLKPLIHYEADGVVWTRELGRFLQRFDRLPAS